MTFPSIPSDKVEAMRRAKWAGASLFDIACDFDVCKATASRYTAGIPVRARAGRTAEHDHKKVLRLLEQGLSASLIRERLGISRAQVFRICKRYRGMTPSQIVAYSRHNHQKAAA